VTDQGNPGVQDEPSPTGLEETFALPDLGAPTLAAGIEAILLLADEPMPVATLAGVLGRPIAEVDREVQRLAEEYTQQSRGFALRDVGGGWRYYTRDDCAALVRRFVVEGQNARLTQAALETLAVVAYRQPVSRSRVGAVRGVNVDGVMRTLVARGLVAEVDHDQTTGAVLYGTTSHFLERMGISSLEELPPISDLLPELTMIDDLDV